MPPRASAPIASTTIRRAERIAAIASISIWRPLFIVDLPGGEHGGPYVRWIVRPGCLPIPASNKHLLRRLHRHHGPASGAEGANKGTCLVRSIHIGKRSRHFVRRIKDSFTSDLHHLLEVAHVFLLSCFTRQTIHVAYLFSSPPRLNPCLPPLAPGPFRLQPCTSLDLPLGYSGPRGFAGPFDQLPPPPPPPPNASCMPHHVRRRSWPSPPSRRRCGGRPQNPVNYQYLHPVVDSCGPR